ncbi:MAG: molybdopterin-synthase adenylyltransferase MoeB [bacterium]
MEDSNFSGISKEQIRRYGRQISLPEIGEKGQKVLLDSKVLIIGAGGLGSPNALYLAAAGIGTIGIIDDDCVELSNLQRQIVHGTKDLGRPKVESAKETIAGINPDVTVVTYRERFTFENAMGIARDYDIVVAACDSFATRHLANDACVLLGKPNVYGSVFGFEGQASLFVPGEGPCYRCLFPSPPPAEMLPDSREAGVMGFLPGIIGLIQTAETIKHLLRIGKTLRNRLLLFDALKMEFRYMKTQRDPACPVCGDNPEIKELKDRKDYINDRI